MEMVIGFNQAADKKKQIQIYADTEGMKVEEIRQLLIDNGVDFRKLPREGRKGKPKNGKFDPEFRESQGEDPVFDAVCRNMGLEEEPSQPAAQAALPEGEPAEKGTSQSPAMPATAPLKGSQRLVETAEYPVVPARDELQDTLNYVRKLFARKRELEKELEKINEIAALIVAASKEE